MCVFIKRLLVLCYRSGAMDVEWQIPPEPMLLPVGSKQFFAASLKSLRGRNLIRDEIGGLYFPRFALTG